MLESTPERLHDLGQMGDEERAALNRELEASFDEEMPACWSKLTWYSRISEADGEGESFPA